MTRMLTGPSPARLWEVDALRGVAVVLMISYHFIWDLAFFGLAPFDIRQAGWQAFARTIGALFLLLLGASLTLRAARTRALLPWALRRGGLIFGCGMLITLGTYLALGNEYVRFGILHLLGSMLVLAVPLVRAPRGLVLLLGLLMLAAGFWLNGLRAGGPWLLWLGLPPAGVSMVDYYPLLPWGGFALLGIAAAQTLYPAGQRGFALPNISRLLHVRGLVLLGQHSLLIYLLHQPLLFAALAAYAALAST